MNASSTRLKASRFPDPEILISHSRPSLGPEESAAVRSVLESGQLVGGPIRARFEQSLSRATGKKGEAAVTSGSAALHLAIRALRLRKGSRVAIPSYGCISLLQAVRRAGAVPLLIDCDPSGFQADPDDFKRRLTGDTGAVIVVHTFGMKAPVAEFASLGLPVIEDIATSIGGRFDGRPAGVAGDLAVCSFHATKMMTTGSGGAVLWDDPDHGEIVRDLLRYDARRDDSVRYNETMNEIAAALGRVQLRRLDRFLAARGRLAEFYRERLDPSLLDLPSGAGGDRPAWHRFVARVHGPSAPWRESLRCSGIASPPPIHFPLHRVLKQAGYEGAETSYQEALSLPIYPDLSDADLSTVTREVNRCPIRSC